MNHSEFLIDGKLYSYPKDKEIIDAFLNEHDERHYIPEHPVQPDNSYRLKSTEYDIAKRLRQDGYTEGQSRNFAKAILKDALPAMYQNIDEWVQEKPLTDVMMGNPEVSFNMIIWEWQHVRDMTPGMEYLVPNMNLYLVSGNRTGLLPDFI